MVLGWVERNYFFSLIFKICYYEKFKRSFGYLEKVSE